MTETGDPQRPLYENKSENPGPGEHFLSVCNNQAKRKALPDAD